MSAQDFRHPLKRARGLGSAQSGLGHWWSQRVTAAVLVVLGLWFVAMVLSLLHIDFATARAMVAKPWNALFLILFVVTAFWHVTLGLHVVIEDYVHTRWREVVLRMVVTFLAVLGALAGVLAVLRIVLRA